MPGGYGTDIYYYWVDEDFFSIKLKLFSRRFGPPGVRICKKNFVRLSVHVYVCI